MLSANIWPRLVFEGRGAVIDWLAGHREVACTDMDTTSPTNTRTLASTARYNSDNDRPESDKETVGGHKLSCALVDAFLLPHVRSHVFNSLWRSVFGDAEWRKERGGESDTGSEEEERVAEEEEEEEERRREKVFLAESGSPEFAPIAPAHVCKSGQAPTADPLIGFTLRCRTDQP